MYTRRVHHIFVAVVLGLTASSVSGRVLVQDDFEGAALNVAKWQSLVAPGVAITQSGGRVFFNRPSALFCYLATTAELDPAVTPLTITGSCTLGADADMDVWTRAGRVANSGGGPGHVLNSGIRINFWQDAVDQGYPPNLDILEKTPGLWPWDSSISDGANIPGDDEVLDWSFVITDDGTAITATFTQTSDPSNTLTLTGISTTHFTTNCVAFTVVNGYLDEVTIATTEAGDTAFNPSPADEETDVSWDVVLSWTAGEFAATHDVYFGTSFEDVNNASRDNTLDTLVGQGHDANTFDPLDRLEFGQTYYWRVDEVNAAPDSTTFRGDVWSFTAEPFTYLVEGITATASCPNDIDMGPEKTIDGSGLDASGQHSTVQEEMWLGTPAAGEVVWIRYDFDRVYKLHQVQIWNYNMTYESLLDFSLKTITIEYATETDNWTVLGEYQLTQGIGKATYAGQVIDLGGIAAKSVRITATSSYGGDNYGLSEVQFYYIPAHARGPKPASGATGVTLNPVLNWRAGREAVSHKVYFSASQEAVANGMALVDTTSATNYGVHLLDLDTTYYWKVDEVNEAEPISVWEGSLWSFTTQEYSVVDDFESYTDDVEAGEAIFVTWVDGYNIDTNGAQVGHDNPPYAELATVHSGRQSMPLYYDNSGTATSSEAKRTFDGPQDWTQSGAAILTLYFYGSPDNDANEPMWVRLTDQSGKSDQVTYGTGAGESVDNQAIAAWHEWSSPLADFGVDLTEVEAMAIGFGDAGPRSSGLMLFDDIRLYP